MYNGLTMKKRSYISSSPSIMGGALVIAGTRVPMERILYMVSQGYTLDEIHKHYPWVTKKVFKAAIAELADKIGSLKHGSSLLQAQNSPR